MPPEDPITEADLAAWRADPDPARAAELCAAVRPDNVGPCRHLALELGREVRGQCADHLGALLAVARMYIVAEALTEAQSTLVAAAQVAPEEPRTFALLGQVMLRLGDARRAVLAFEQATSRGLAGPATRALFDRARHYAEIQDTQGEEAVAEAVRAELAPGVAVSGPPPPVITKPPPTQPSGERAPRSKKFSSTLIGFGGGEAPMFDDADVEKAISAFVGEEAKRADQPEPKPASDPPPKPLSDPPYSQQRQVLPTTRYSMIKPDARTPARKRSDRPVDRDATTPAKHRDFGMDTWAAPPAAAREAPAREPPAPERKPKTDPGTLRSGRSAAPMAPLSEPPGPFDRSSSIPPPGAEKRDSARPKAKTRHRNLKIAAGVALVAVFGVQAGRLIEHAESARAAGVLVQEAEKAMHVGSPKTLADAEAALRRAHEVDPGSMEVALATVNNRLLRALESDESGPGLSEALDQARMLAAPASELAAAEIVLALAAKNGARADEVMKAHEEDRGRGLTATAFYELAAGAALERRGDPKAADRFQAAVRADPSLFPAEVRLVRAQLLYGDAAQGGRRARAIAPSRPEAAALSSLSAYVADPGATPPTPPATPEEELPRSLRSLMRALALRANSEPTGRGAAFAATIESADVPAVAMLCGQLALAAGEPSSAEFGAKRALELSPSFAPALALLARTALARGDVVRMKEAAAKLPGREGGELRAIAAYEDADLPQMEEIVRAMSPPATEGDASRLGIERLRGTVLAGDKLKNVTRADPVWGELLKVDAALDIGDLETARELSDGWQLASQHPLRALRLARRLRYEGRLEDARKVLETAAPTRSTLIERALLAGELRTDRAAVLALVEGDSMPEKPWLIGYLKARQGIIDRATKILAPLEVPNDSAPRSIRIVAVLAYGELTDEKRGKAEMQRILETWPKNPDVIRAAVGYDLLPKSALKRRAR